MTSRDLIMIFQHSQSIIKNNPIIFNKMLKCQAGSRLYLNDYCSSLRYKKGNGKVSVIENTTFQCARDTFVLGKKTAVLNFANPHEPGGGVLRGAMAQEECLCRCSDLYNALNQPYFMEHYYRYHRNNSDYYFSDRLIYSPNVTVFKSDDIVPQVLPNPFHVDVITCAAPYMPGCPQKTNEELLTIYKSRIRNILEVAMSNEVDILILGAFGCGAFRNDPDLMAKAFADLLVGEKYAEFFEKVFFAIKRTGDFCQNLCSFETAFYRISAEGNKRRFWM